MEESRGDDDGDYDKDDDADDGGGGGGEDNLDETRVSAHKSIV